MDATAAQLADQALELADAPAQLTRRTRAAIRNEGENEGDDGDQAKQAASRQGASSLADLPHARRRELGAAKKASECVGGGCVDPVLLRRLPEAIAAEGRRYGDRLF
ncbi:MAG: hypothetical protein ABI629_19075 [bacterium]